MIARITTAVAALIAMCGSPDQPRTETRIDTVFVTDTIIRFDTIYTVVNDYTFDGNVTAIGMIRAGRDVIFNGNVTSVDTVSCGTFIFNGRATVIDATCDTVVIPGTTSFLNQRRHE